MTTINFHIIFLFVNYLYLQQKDPIIKNDKHSLIRMHNFEKRNKLSDQSACVLRKYSSQINALKFNR